MGRKKVRNYPSIQYYDEMLKEYFENHNGSIIYRVIKAIGENPDYYGIEDLMGDEYHMRWGLDCGWILLYPRDKKMAHEWELDNGKYGAYVWTDRALPYCPQSTTLKRIMIEEAVKDLGLDDTFWISTRLD